MKANKFWISFLACFIVIVLLGGIAIFAIPSLQTNIADGIIEKSQKYKDVCEENDTLRTELANKNSEYTNAISRLNTAQTSLTNEIALNAQLNTQLANAINEKTLLQVSLNDKDADIQTLNAQITAKNTEIANIQAMLNDSNTYIDELETYISELETYIEDLENEIISLSMEIENFDEIRRTVDNMTIVYMPEYSYIELCFYGEPEHNSTYGGMLHCYYYEDTNQFSTIFQGYDIYRFLDLMDYGFGFEVMQHNHYTVFMENCSSGFVATEFLDLSDDCSLEFDRIYLNGELTTLDTIRNYSSELTYAFTLEPSYNYDGEISNIKINIFATTDGSQPLYID